MPRAPPPPPPTPPTPPKHYHHHLQQQQQQQQNHHRRHHHATLHQRRLLPHDPRQQQQQYLQSSSSSPSSQQQPVLPILLVLQLLMSTTVPGLAAASPPLEIVNPWLSACDLRPDSATTDLRGGGCEAAATAAAAGTGCPPPCPPRHAATTTTATTTTNNTQCLHYLKESHKEEVCGPVILEPERRRAVLHTLRMRHCCEHVAADALPVEAVIGGGERCRRFVGALLEVDALAARLTCAFAEVLARYDCGQVYSIAHQCNNCKEAYRRWVCSSLVPHYNGAGQRVRPCRSVCQDVEQQCPYLLPGDRAPSQPTQYAGEPTFLCLDPNIPETGEQRRKSSIGDEDCCYAHCGSAGRGWPGRRRLCERCPGRAPSEAAAEAPAPVDCAAAAFAANSTAPRTQGCGFRTAGATSGAAPPPCCTPDVISKVFLLLWTAWIVVATNDGSGAAAVVPQCLLLVLCATTVQRTTWWTKTKRRLCS